jgi:site-specific DNA-methyltransferase (adenine-specific)
MIKISDIKLNPVNPRAIKDKRFEALCKSIKEFPKMMRLRPIVIDKQADNIALGGNMRLRALIELGYTEIDDNWVIDCGDMTEEEKKRFVVVDNIGFSSWDMDILSSNYEVEELKGYGLEEQYIIEDFGDNPQDDVVPEAPEPICKLGQIWKLGKHRLMCGDSTNIDHVEKLMDGKKADMVFTDPPYNVNYSGRGKETSNTIKNDNKSDPEFDDFLSKIFSSYKNGCKISCPFYICHSSSSQIIFEKAMVKTDLIVKNQIIWNKTVASMGWGDYRWKHEPIFYATYGKKAVKFYGDRCQYTVWNENWSIDKLKANLKKIAEKQEKGGGLLYGL